MNLNLVKAVIWGTSVPDEIRDQRQKICLSCDKYRVDRFGYGHCGLCGCGVSSEVNRVLNLTAYVENLPSWGCKHPLRKRGFGWKQ